MTKENPPFGVAQTLTQQRCCGLSIINTEVAPTCKFWGSCSVLVAVDGRRLLIHLICLLALLPVCSSRVQLALRECRVVETAVGGQQTPHLHGHLTG